MRQKVVINIIAFQFYGAPSVLSVIFNFHLSARIYIFVQETTKIGKYKYFAHGHKLRLQLNVDTHHHRHVLSRPPDQIRNSSNNSIFPKLLSIIMFLTFFH